MWDLHIIKLRCEDKPSFMWRWHRCLKSHFVVRFDAVYFMGDTIITQTSGQKINWNGQKKERIKTGKLLDSCSPFIYLTSRTSKFHVMPLWMHLYSCSFYEEKTIFPRHYSLWLREVLLRMKMICHSNAMVYFDIRKTTVMTILKKKM